MSPPCVSGQPEVNTLPDQDSERELTPEEIQEEIRKYVRFLPQVAEPNLARVREIQELLKQGIYPTREMVEGAAARLALRFLRKE